jgi:hypothetical protein
MSRKPQPVLVEMPYVNLMLTCYANSMKQLKHRFQKWGNLQQYIKHDEMVFMVKTLKRRTDEGKTTVFEQNGVEVDHEKLERSAKRIRLNSSSPGCKT